MIPSPKEIRQMINGRAYPGHKNRHQKHRSQGLLKLRWFSIMMVALKKKQNREFSFF